MTLLLNRGARLTVYRSTVGSLAPVKPTGNGIERIVITDLRITFSIKKGSGKEPNTCEVSIFNLAEATRRQLETKPLLIELVAGHDNEFHHLFTGDLRFGSSTFVSPDWKTTLHLGDGDRAYKHGRATKSYDNHATLRTILHDAAKGMGLELPNDFLAAASADLATQFASGETQHGPARDELTRLLTPFGYQWSIQNGKLVILKEDASTGALPIEVSQDTGMIGSPEYGSPEKSGKAPTLGARSLLYPAITPGNQVKVRSTALAPGNAIFKVDSVEHKGDTHGDDWFTEMDLKPYKSKT